MTTRTATKPRAAIYTRVSQDRDGSSTATDRQERECRAWCRREGVRVVEVFEDVDQSAYSGKARPAFERLKEELASFDVLVFWKTDRLVRRTTDFYRLLEACETAGVRLVSVIDPIDTSTPILAGVAGLIASMGQQESYNIGERVKLKHEEQARKGRAHGRRRAYGYTKDMQIVPAEAEAIREARDRILTGSTMRSICNDWNVRNVKPTTAQAWRVSTFKRMMTGPHLAGLRVFRGEVVGKGDWEPILSEDDHRRLVQRLGDPKITHRGRPATYLLTSYMVCGKCGARLRCSVGKEPGSRVWACRRTPAEQSHCGGLAMNAPPLDEWMEAAILYRLASPAIAKAMRKTSKPSKAEGPSLATLEKQVTQIGIDHDEGLITRAEWLDRRALLLPRLEEARSEVARENGTTPLAGFTATNARDRWEALDLAGRRAVVGALLESVTIAPATKGPHFDPDRISVAWRI
jgi:site-specific DNA recombinase